MKEMLWHKRKWPEHVMKSLDYPNEPLYGVSIEQLTGAAIRSTLYEVESDELSLRSEMVPTRSPIFSSSRASKKATGSQYFCPTCLTIQLSSSVYLRWVPPLLHAATE